MVKRSAVCEWYWLHGFLAKNTILVFRMASGDPLANDWVLLYRRRYPPPVLSLYIVGAAGAVKREVVRYDFGLLVIGDCHNRDMVYRAADVGIHPPFFCKKLDGPRHFCF
jgi:hypothetical protein